MSDRFSDLFTAEVSSSELARVVVVGTSCTGKSTFSRALSNHLGAPHIELDALHWLKDWQPRPAVEFRNLVEAVIAQERWVVDGNYGVVRDIVWPRATAIVWLNLPLPIVIGRALVRCVRRSLTSQEIYSGNVESFRRSFLSRDSILLWIVTSFHQRRRELSSLAASPQYRALKFYQLRSSAEVASFLNGMSAEPQADQRTPITRV